MLGTGKHVQLLGGGTAEPVVGHHAPDGFFDHTSRVQFQGPAEGHDLQTTRVTGVTIPELTFPLVGRDTHLVGVDDDDMVTTVNVGGEIWFTLAAEQVSCGYSQATQHHISGIDDIPLTGNVTSLGVISRH